MVYVMTKIYHVLKETSKILWGKEKMKQEPTVKKNKEINIDWFVLHTQ
jgi:hypothetical protein